MPISTTSPSVVDVLSRIRATTKNETTAPAPRPMTSIELPTWARSEEPIEIDLAGRDLAGQGRAEPDGVSSEHLDGAVGADQPVGDREPVAHDPGGGLEDPDAEQHHAPEPERAQCRLS